MLFDQTPEDYESKIIRSAALTDTSVNTHFLL